MARNNAAENLDSMIEVCNDDDGDGDVDDDDDDDDDDDRQNLSRTSFWNQAKPCKIMQRQWSCVVDAKFCLKSYIIPLTINNIFGEFEILIIVKILWNG